MTEGGNRYRENGGLSEGIIGRGSALQYGPVRFPLGSLMYLIMRFDYCPGLIRKMGDRVSYAREEGYI